MVATGRDRDRRSYLSYPHLPSKGREYRSLLKLNSSHKEKKLDHILGKQSLLLGFPAEQAGCTGNCCLLVWLVVQPAKWQPSPRGSDTEGCVCDSPSVHLRREPYRNKLNHHFSLHMHSSSVKRLSSNSQALRESFL